MTRLRDPYLAGWNAAIEAATAELDKRAATMSSGVVRALAKPDPIPDDHWRRVNDGDLDYDPQRKEPGRD